MAYEFIPHTADIGIRVKGKTLSELFRNAGFALFDIMTEIKSVHPTQPEPVELEAEDREVLLNFWLSDLLKQYTIKGRLLSRFEIASLSDTKLKAVVYGEPYDPSRHRILKEIKAVTFHNLSVRKTNGGWEAEVIFDV